MRANELDWDTYAAQTAARASYERGSREPSPEQFNTRVADAGSHLHAAPTELNREYLLDEGYAPQLDRRGVQLGGRRGRAVPRPRRRPGAVRDLPGAGERPVHPVLRPPAREHHRRVPVPGADDRPWSTCSRTATASCSSGCSAPSPRSSGSGWSRGSQGCMERYGERFVTSPVWESYAQVVLAMQHCAVIATDSGSIQEEANILEVPCVTLRFGSDRGRVTARRRQLPGPARRQPDGRQRGAPRLLPRRPAPVGAGLPLGRLPDARRRRRATAAGRGHAAVLRGMALRAHARAMTPSSAVEVSRSLRGITRTV